jgi:hypothetical protein
VRYFNAVNKALDWVVSQQVIPKSGVRLVHQ